MDLLDVLRKENGKGVPYERCLCHKLVPISECRKLYSGVRNYVEILCPDCRNNLKDHARIVCLGCRRLTSFLPPQRHKSGFVFERGRHYHIRECCFCANQPVVTDAGARVMACPVLELERFAKEQHLRTQPDPEIIRHAEQINLTGDDSFATLVRRQFRPTI